MSARAHHLVGPMHTPRRLSESLAKARTLEHLYVGEYQEEIRHLLGENMAAVDLDGPGNMYYLAWQDWWRP